MHLICCFFRTCQHLFSKCGSTGVLSMKIAIITTCTNRKRKPPKEPLWGRSLPKGSQQDLLHNWVQRIRNDEETFCASNLYCGRGFCEIVKIKSRINAKIWIISFGMGLIGGDMDIPPYQLTLSRPSEDSILNKIVPQISFNASEWWNGINQKLHGTTNSIANLIHNEEDTVFVISVSKSYLKLVMSDLFSLPDHDLSRVRIVGPPHSRNIPIQYRHLWMPYDDRFDGPNSPIPGTRSDFSQRIARHFIEKVLVPHPLFTAEDHGQIVEKTMRTMPRPIQIKRRSLSDIEIAEIIINNWDIANGSCSRMLRVLRDRENGACEQSRFAAIFRKIKTERFNVKD